MLSQLALSKSYSYDYIKTNLDFNIDGSVIVRQERTYDFVGSFTYAYLDILKKDVEDVSFLGIIDLDTNESLTYDLQEDSTHAKATWHYSANDQVKRFLIVYKIEGAVQRYEDVAEFYWKVIEDSHESIDRLDYYVNLPESSPNLFKIFVHSSASPGEINFSRDFKTAIVSMRSIPRDTFVEFRVLTEPSIFSGVGQINEKDYENVLNEEKNIFYSPVISFFNEIWVIILLSAIPIIAFIYFFLKYGRNPKVDYDLTYEQEPPDKVPPMALSNLLEGEETKTEIRREAMGLIATIFDLARRGYLEVMEEKKKRFLGLGESTEQVFIRTKKDTSELEDFEKDILSFLFSCCSDKRRVTSSQIVKYCRSNPYKIKDKIEDIDEEARKWFEKKYFPITEKISSDIKKKFTAVMLVYLLGIIVYFSFSFNFYLIFPMFVTVLILFSSAMITRRTYNSALELKKWKAFKKYISDFSAMKDAPITLLKIWDEYLIYAIALGVAQKMLENLKELSIETGRSIAAVSWYHGISPIPGKTISPEAISGFINNLSHTVSALNSSTSVGGGFSGGGGGGGGGGSGAG
jgi:uncharacterized membrane protein